MLVVGIDEDKAVLTATKEIVEFALGLDDSFERTEALQMGTAYVGDQTTGGLCCLYECLDITWMAGPHLDDGNLMFLCQTKKGLGHTYVVVEVALGVEHIVFLREHSGNKFLSCGLAIGRISQDSIADILKPL